MPRPIIIAIDGYSSCGKSTLARAMAAELGYLYIDSGAMYRAVTLYFLENRVNWNLESAVAEALKQISIGFEWRNADLHTLLNGRDVEADIRQMPVSENVSPVSTLSPVRRAMVAQQRILGARRGIVMDGRDIGTVVFPDAELKIFLTADVGERVRRRFEELRRKNTPVDIEEVRKNLLLRDQIDSTREDSPLRQAPDAVVIDNTNLNTAEQSAMALALARERIRSFGENQSGYEEPPV